VALKVAVNPGDRRFDREATLLSRIQDAHVPALRDHGQWACADRSFPYLAMQWVEGVPLYEWSEERNPTSRQVLRLLAQAARALAATHEARGVHRDVKGDNLLVRADGQAFLTDFGSSIHAGAAPLTWEPLPPGTPTYRSPEAWRFGISAHERGAHYDSKPADDLFALGVTAYRLVTDEYPPPTDPGQIESLIWYVDNPDMHPTPPRVLNPRVDRQLSTLILRMLSLRPEARTTARELAKVLERRAQQAGPDADLPLFPWETLPRSEWRGVDAAEANSPHHRLRYRAQEVVRATEQRELAQRARSKGTTPGKNVVPLPTLAPQKQATPPTATPRQNQAQPSARTDEWPSGLAVAAIALLMVFAGWLATRGSTSEEPEFAQVEQEDAGTADGGTVELGTGALSAHFIAPKAPRGWPGLHKSIPTKPLPGQRRVESSGKCENPVQVAVNGGCWLEFGDMLPPCKEGIYEWRGRCYEPVYLAPRQPTSAPE
jgi:serine/threonine protein kinase